MRLQWQLAFSAALRKLGILWVFGRLLALAAVSLKLILLIFFQTFQCFLIIRKFTPLFLTDARKTRDRRATDNIKNATDATDAGKKIIFCKTFKEFLLSCVCRVCHIFIGVCRTSVTSLSGNRWRIRAPPVATQALAPKPETYCHIIILSYYHIIWVQYFGISSQLKC